MRKRCSQTSRKRLSKAELPVFYETQRIGFIMSEAAAPVTIAVHEKAIEIARDHNSSVYGALIVASALSMGCGRLIEGLVIENPFASN